jgi:hypothetical protein
LLACSLIVVVATSACGREPAPETVVEPRAVGDPRPDIYAEVTLAADLTYLTEDQREMLALLIDAADVMDDLFWKQAYRADHDQWLDSISNDAARRFAAINYGPWDRLANERPFIEAAGPRPLGANFYPPDMSKEEFETAYLPGKEGLYTLIRRDPAGALHAVPYHVAYADELKKAADILRRAAGLAVSTDFANYLKLRANALISDSFQVSDLYWMDVKDNEIELVIGPIETYEDRLLGLKAAYEAYVLVKDMEWSARLAQLAMLLPQLQAGLPVADAYKQETPGSDSDLNAYDIVYYAGRSNAGPKTIAINLPNDPDVQLQKGTRRLQLKNAMRAKFDEILEPIADVLVDESQRGYVSFDAFFANVMFHEVAHGLGVKYTITGGDAVRQALRDVAAGMEEGKADVLGLYMVTELAGAGELGDVDLRDYYVTFMANVFRSIRFGASNAQGKANMVCFNFFAEHGAIVRDSQTGRYRVDFERMESATRELSRLLLTLQGDGDYDGAKALMDDKSAIGPHLQADLERLMPADIPVDITLRQGIAELGIDGLNDD